jgi:tetratricopeptide (TPR) repeat protein
VPPPAGAREALAAAIREGVSLVRQREYARAVQRLEPYREIDHFTLLHALGIAYVRLDRNEEAYAALLRAHALRPEVAAPLLPAALACVKMARTCDAYRDLAREYKELGGQLVRFADKIAYHVPVALVMPGLRGDVH